ncbi:MAG: M23 family metallopeptidase [Spirochaetes bacterium]|nr:M23 family metallopeptidase [Spirochaetota bacterium]
MKQTNNFKKAEKKFLLFSLNALIFIKKSFLSFINFVLNIGKQNITIMFIPHSEKKVFNLRINIFMLFTVTFLTVIAIVITGIFGFGFYTEKNLYNSAKKNIEINEKRSKLYEEMINEIIDNHAYLKSELNKLLAQINSSAFNELRNNYLPSGGPLTLTDSEFQENYNPEKEAVKNLIKDYSYSIQAFSELNKMAKNYNKLLKDIPFGPPLQGPYIYTSGFGWRIHPIHRVLDMHHGIDLAWSPGTPIIATAPGTVEKAEYNIDGYGWYCKISHKLGFATLYAHLMYQPIVKPGDKVQKGQIIGYMGRTGATTGVHIHYEVYLGGNLKDPWQFVIAY